MTLNFLLDTNAAIARIADNASLRTKMEMADEVYITTIVLGELYNGAEKSTRVEDNITIIDQLAAELDVLGCDIETARWYGKVNDGLRRKGRPIPQNDMWIAATALQHDLILLTKDQHFQHVDGLAVESW